MKIMQLDVVQNEVITNPLEQFSDWDYCIDLLGEFFRVYESIFISDDPLDRQKIRESIKERSLVSPSLHKFIKDLDSEFVKLYNKGSRTALTNLLISYDNYLKQILADPNYTEKSTSRQRKFLQVEQGVYERIKGLNLSETEIREIRLQVIESLGFKPDKVQIGKEF